MSNVTISARSLLTEFSVDISDGMIQKGNERLLPSCLSLSLGTTSSSTVIIIDNDGTNNNMYTRTFEGTQYWGG